MTSISVYLERASRTFTWSQRPNKVISGVILLFVFWLWVTLYLQPQILQALLSASFPLSSALNGFGSSKLTSSYFHFLIPSGEPSSPLCRTALSAAALNYPSPMIFNWEADFNSSGVLDGGRHVAKINAVAWWLFNLDSSHDNDLVFVVEGNDTWFQLRPEALIQRYHDINSRSDKRLRRIYGKSFKQRIVFSAQKQCAGRENDRSCLAVPPSELPSDVYGPKTDQLIEGDANPYALVRPRHLSSASIIGPVGKLRALYQKAQSELEKQQYSSETAVFAEIFGEQESCRERSRVKTGLLQRVSSMVSRNGRADKSKASSNPPECLDCDYGIGLDYRGELLSPTISSEQDDFVSITFENKDSTRDAAVTAGSRRTASLPLDVRHSTPPFWTPDYSGETNLPDKSWAETALLTNVWSTTVPAAIRLEAPHHQKGSSRSSPLWRKLWFIKHLRALCVAHAKSFRMPFAVLRRPAPYPQGDVHEYWSLVEGYGGVKVVLHLDLNETTSRNKWLVWEDICPSPDEVFGDGHKFRTPIYHLPLDVNAQARQVAEWKKRLQEEHRGH